MTTTRTRTKRCEHSRSDAVRVALDVAFFGTQKEMLRRVLGVRFTADDPAAWPMSRLSSCYLSAAASSMSESPPSPAFSADFQQSLWGASDGIVILLLLPNNR